MKCREVSVAVGWLPGEEPGLFDVCECGTMAPCLTPGCPEGRHVVVVRCKACVLRGKPVRRSA